MAYRSEGLCNGITQVRMAHGDEQARSRTVAKGVNLEVSRRARVYYSSASRGKGLIEFTVLQTFQ
jgi:hypothetical protein